jgi:hypothetical protein
MPVRSAQQPAGTAPTSEPNATKAEVLRIFANAATAGGLSPTDLPLSACGAAHRAAPQEAEARVTQVAYEAARITKDATEKARKTAVATGFLTAASLILSLAAVGRPAGRHHRDTGRAARLF